MHLRRPTLFRFALLALALAGFLGAAWLLLPPATADERAVLEKVAKTQPVTTCLALKTRRPSGYHIPWHDKERDAAIIRANELAQSRDVHLALDLESLIDNALKLDCKTRATLSTPAFSGTFAFVEVTDKISRDTIVLKKNGKGWEFVKHYPAPIQSVIV
ncbi:hypothetical protein HNP52_003926 [Sphingomonas kyeonggiensis]|uniref:Uncharacterized protein n=1 Tax=Sphingomonas kyeonggiensis TaxID=1268553 RepID=A0A7W7NUH8_9SPHN|nr:hypothetical protein [Sphingomonas kyeonggiensis]MBB4840829.1 hypothetical protein [Sphingomonas kyeonggiensis]